MSDLESGSLCLFPPWRSSLKSAPQFILDFLSVNWLDVKELYCNIMHRYTICLSLVLLKCILTMYGFMFVLCKVFFFFYFKVPELHSHSAPFTL